ELLSRPVDADPHAGDGHLEAPGDLPVRFALDFPSEQKLAVERRERLESLAQQVGVNVPLLLRPALPRIFRQRDFRAAPADEIDRGAQRDDPHPRGEGGLVAVGGKGAERARERPLRGGLGGRGAPGPAPRGGGGRGGGQRDEFGEGVFLPEPRSLDQGGFRRGVRGDGDGRPAGGERESSPPGHGRSSRKASNDLIAFSLWLLARSRNSRPLPRAAPVPLGSTSPQAFG